MVEGYNGCKFSLEEKNRNKTDMVDIHKPCTWRRSKVVQNDKKLGHIGNERDDKECSFTNRLMTNSLNLGITKLLDEQLWYWTLSNNVTFL